MGKKPSSLAWRQFCWKQWKQANGSLFRSKIGAVGGTEHQVQAPDIYRLFTKRLGNNVTMPLLNQLALMALEGWAHPWKQKP